MAKTKPMSKEEKLRRKRECEKKRREKIRNDSVKLQALKDLKHEIYERAKETGKVKMVKDMTIREKRNKRTQWRKNIQAFRKRKKAAAEANKFIETNSPPQSPFVADEYPLVEQHQQVELVNNEESLQKKRGRKQVKRNRSSDYRKNQKLQEEIRNVTKKYEKDKKKYFRLVQKNQEHQVELTPNTKVKKIAKGCKLNSTVRKRLVFAEAITQELHSTFKTLRGHKEKQIFSKIIGGKIVKRYRVLGHTKDFLPKKYFLSNKNRLNRFQFERLQAKSKLSLRNTLEKFWEDEEHVSISPGKNDFVKKNGIKKQKHYMNGSLKNLYEEFKKKNNVYISYSLFCRLRPFWIKTPNVNSRDTCLCFKHENFRLYTEKLFNLKVLNRKSPYEIVSSLICPQQTENCYRRVCITCKDNTVPYMEFDGDKIVEMKKWVHKKEPRVSVKTKKEILVQLTVKDIFETTVLDLVKTYEDIMPPYLIHIMNIKHQHLTMRSLKANLSERDLLLHIDFSENYLCKYSSEPQSVHFGASRQQITLHTGMMYTKNGKQGFCTVSPSTRHDAEAILAHIKPVVHHYLQKFPTVQHLYFLSDSPNNQYRNKKMFLFISKRIPMLFQQINTVTWNYSEAGHGKGAPDGVGGLLKRVADQEVATGKDVSNFDSLFSVLNAKTKAILLLKVNNFNIEEECHWLQTQKPNDFAIKGCMKIHQVCWGRGTENIMFRTLSCLECKVEEICKHYHLTQLSKGGSLLQPNHFENLNKGKWVVVRYEGQEYPGEVMEVCEDSVKVSVMHPAGPPYHFKWPTKRDCIFYKKENVLRMISPPGVANSRGLYKFY